MSIDGKSNRKKVWARKLVHSMDNMTHGQNISREG